MTVITLRLDEDLLGEISARAKTLHMKRAEYIRKAIKTFNDRVRRMEEKEKLINASMKVRDESMRINAEFDAIEDDFDA